MSKRQSATGAAGGAAAGYASALPDLTGVDLRSLRVMDDARLSAAVEHVLDSAARFADTVHAGLEEDPSVPPDIDHAVGIRSGHRRIRSKRVAEGFRHRRLRKGKRRAGTNEE